MPKKEKCTSEKWNHCRVEKMGCTGCYYNNTLEEAIKYLKIIKDTDLLKAGYPYGVESIEIVLKALEKLQKRNDRQFKLLSKRDKQLENSISKKIVKDKIEELEGDILYAGEFESKPFTEEELIYEKIKVLKELLEG